MTGCCAGGPGAVVLAAGRSERMGRPKQLLVLDGEPLVRRAARAAVEAGLWPVVVVVGDRADEVRAALAGLPVATVANLDFARGMAGSLRRGLSRLAECAPDAAGVLVLTCDQPRVTAEHLVRLAEAAREKDKAIAASAYAGALGVPAFFSAPVLPELRALQGDQGARGVIASDLLRVAAVPFPGGELDVDTPEDWERAQRG